MAEISEEEAKKKKVFFFAIAAVGVVAVLFLYFYVNQSSSGSAPVAEETRVSILVPATIERSAASGDLTKEAALKNESREAIINRVEERKLTEAQEKINRMKANRLVAGGRLAGPSTDRSVDDRINDLIAAEAGKRVKDNVPDQEISNPFAATTAPVVGKGTPSASSGRTPSRKGASKEAVTNATVASASSTGFYFVTAEEPKASKQKTSQPDEEESEGNGFFAPKTGSSATKKTGGTNSDAEPELESVPIKFYAGRIIGDYNVTSGDRVRIRNTEAMQVLSWSIPKNTVMEGVVSLSGSRLNILVDGIFLEEVGGSLPVTVSVYDGTQQGIRVNYSQSKDQAIEATQQLGETAGNMVGGGVFGVGQVLNAAGQMARGSQQRISLKDGRKINLVINETN